MYTTKKLAVLAILLVSISAAAQDGSSKVIGLYKDQNDFISNKLTYKVSCDSQDGSINVDNIFSPSKIVVKENGKKTDLMKTGFFGYLDCNNKAYKFVGDQAYEIIDTTGFYIYKHTYRGPSGKGYVDITAYYFNRNVADALLPLTKKNLSNAFASNTKFLYALETTFHNDNELTDYVSYLKCFKIKYVYNETVKK